MTFARDFVRGILRMPAVKAYVRAAERAERKKRARFIKKVKQWQEETADRASSGVPSEAHGSSIGQSKAGQQALNGHCGSRSG